jgi:hypothetical protein
MITLINKEKEFKLVPRTRKVVDLTERLKTKNLNDLIFNGLNNGDLKVLAELLKAFAENEDGSSVFSSLNTAYDFIDEWMRENKQDYKELYKVVIGVTNEMGFFKEKMTEEELNSRIKNPIPIINIQELMNNSAQKFMDQMAEEEFKGYKG